MNNGHHVPRGPFTVRMKPKLFAQLRPRQPLSALILALDDDWRPPEPQDQGGIWGVNHGCFARIDVQQQLGVVGFYRAFPGAFSFEGLSLGMSLAAARAHRPTLTPAALPPGQPVQLTEYRDLTAAGDLLRVRFFRRQLVGLELECPGRVYPGAPAEVPADPSGPGLEQAWGG